jgi:gamma-glutamyl:cysteine ligase YbdK (ATP-grasp superfamily)
VGIEIEQEQFSEEDRRRFAARLDDQISALELLLARPGFGEGSRSLGAELEVSLVDARGRPLGINRTVLAETHDARLNLEVDRFNLELNTRPVPCAGRPFTALAAELAGGLAELRRRAAAHGGRVATIGILPTLTADDLTAGALTDTRRYRALSAGIRALRDRPFVVQIAGDETLSVEADDVTMQGANTSFQVHVRVAPAEFARVYNAAQIATAPALAVSGNSPLFLGRRLWDETRIALCRQSVDDRLDADGDDWRPARVSFGHGWVRAGALELFTESVAFHAPLLPVVGAEDALAAVRGGMVPALAELRLHHGTVWRWNRAVYDDAGGGHLRIELRALPSGPTVADMIANAAFLIGLTLGLAPDADALVRRLTFGHARRNFYQAARHGLDAELLWPADAAPSPRPTSVRALVPRLLDVARAGLASAGVDAAESDAALAIVAERVARGVTGARWQRRTLAALEVEMPRADAVAALLERYLEAEATERPVHEWPVAP